MSSANRWSVFSPQVSECEASCSEACCLFWLRGGRIQAGWLLCGTTLLQLRRVWNGPSRAERQGETEDLSGLVLQQSRKERGSNSGDLRQLYVVTMCLHLITFFSGPISKHVNHSRDVDWNLSPATLGNICCLLLFTENVSASLLWDF